MSDSILTSTKKILGVDETYTVFDQDIMIHINSVFSTLSQLGVGPDYGFEITGATETWGDFLNGDKNLNAVRTYVYLRVRLLFDPPTTGYLVEALKEQIKELEWRLNVQREETEYLYPGTVIDPSLAIIDGGAP
jgi:hypothetical protein